jgi:hypothetical protein
MNTSAVKCQEVSTVLLFAFHVVYKMNSQLKTYTHSSSPLICFKDLNEIWFLGSALKAAKKIHSGFRVVPTCPEFSCKECYQMSGNSLTYKQNLYIKLF